jgi:glutathionylspermidine synthase
MADHLVEGELYLALNGVVLEARDAALLRHLTETFTTACVRAGAVLARDVPALVAMGFPWLAAELLAQEEPGPPLVGRFDFVQDRDGHWWLLEFNSDTPSGFRETTRVEPLAQRDLPEATGLHSSGTEFAAALRDALLASVGELHAGATLGLVTSASELEDLAQMDLVRRLVEGPLARRGIDVVLADLDNVSSPRGCLALCGKRVGTLYRGAPLEAMLGTPTFGAIFEAAAGGRLTLLNGLFGLLLQHKGLLAWLWEHQDDPYFTVEERNAIQRHLPPTWAISSTPPEEDRRDLVAKQYFGREGEEVFFGDTLDDATWALLERRRTYVAQRRIAVAELDAAIPTACGPVSQHGCATVGCFSVRGRGVGFYTRFGGRIIDRHARWFATFEEAAPPTPGDWDG